MPGRAQRFDGNGPSRRRGERGEIGKGRYPGIDRASSSQTSEAATAFRESSDRRRSIQSRLHSLRQRSQPLPSRHSRCRRRLGNQIDDPLGPQTEFHGQNWPLNDPRGRSAILTVFEQRAQLRRILDAPHSSLQPTIPG